MIFSASVSLRGKEPNKTEKIMSECMENEKTCDNFDLIKSAQEGDRKAMDQLIHRFSVALLGRLDQIEVVTGFFIFHTFRHNFFRFVWLLSSETDRSRKNHIVSSEVMYFPSEERQACASG
jgi:hypothetical protein